MDATSLMRETTSIEDVNQVDGSHEAEEEVIPEQEIKDIVEKFTDELDEKAQNENGANGH